MKGSEVQINREKTPYLIVVGGGAAGFYTALTAAEADPSLRIALIEPAARVLSKVRVSGGGRCNVTHDCMDPKQLTTHYPRGARELLGPFHQWGPRQMITWLKERGSSIKNGIRRQDVSDHGQLADDHRLFHQLRASPGDSSLDRCGVSLGGS